MITLVTLTSSEESSDDFEQPLAASGYWTRGSKNTNALQICVEQLRTNKARMKQIKDILYFKDPDRMTKTYENALHEITRPLPRTQSTKSDTFD